jgi:steroid delta-isomerase-like uncharacterized protein
MTRDDILAFTNRLVENWERADDRALAAGYADDATLDSPLLGKRKGRGAIEASFRDLFRMFDKWRITIDNTVIDPISGRAVLLLTAQATQVGDMLGYPASHRRFTLRTALVFDFAKGRIASETRLYDFTGLLVQLGVLTAKGR